jgi:iron-sulfur cluster assembly accessory protein
MEGVSTSTETPVLIVTEPAARRVRAVAAREGKPQAFLRIRIVAGGCDGFEYEMGLEDTAAETDQVLDQFGLKVLVDPRSAPILQGSSLEYHDLMLGGGLKIVNPQATHECTCGKSFAL